MLRRVFWGLALGLLLHGLVDAAGPPADTDRLITERRAFMSVLGAVLRAAWDKFDAGEVATIEPEARWIAENAPRITGLFPPRSFGPGSRGRPTIADMAEEFRRLSRELERAAEILVERARAGDAERIRTQLLQVGSACKACHHRFVTHPP